jgi:hypothetical protein
MRAISAAPATGPPGTDPVLRYLGPLTGQKDKSKRGWPKPQLSIQQLNS